MAFGQSHRKSAKNGGEKKKKAACGPDFRSHCGGYLTHSFDGGRDCCMLSTAVASCQTRCSVMGVARSVLRRPFEPHTDCQAVLNEIREELDKAIKRARA